MKIYRQTIQHHRSRLLSYPNVVGVGLGYKTTSGMRTAEQAVVVFVTKKLSREAIPIAQTIPQKVDGLPTDVVEIGEIRIYNERVKKYRPAPPGVSIGNFKITAGTFGAMVLEQSSGRSLILSNNHVLANETNGNDGRAKLGDPILQPGPADGGNLDQDSIGRLYRFIPIHYWTEKASCPFASRFEKFINRVLQIFYPNYFVKLFKNERTTNLVDAALAEPLNEADVESNILEIGTVHGMTEATLDMVVKKSGRTTQLTTGQILAVGVTLSVGFSDGRSALFEDQFVTTPMGGPGDSGSLVLDEKNRAVGLLSAGSDQATVCNRIQNVAQLLDVTF